MTTQLHPRQLIADRVIALLTGATAAGSRVTDTRIDPERPGNLPAIEVYMLSEEVDAESRDTAPRELTRHPRLVIVAWAYDTAAAPVSRALNAIALEIETAMDSDTYLSGAAGDSILSATEFDINREGPDPLVGKIALVYSVTYRTVQGAIAITPFERVKATVQIAGSSPDNAPIETFDIPQ